MGLSFGARRARRSSGAEPKFRRDLLRADRVLSARTSAFTSKELDAADWIPSLVALAVDALFDATHRDANRAPAHPATPVLCG